MARAIQRRRFIEFLGRAGAVGMTMGFVGCRPGFSSRAIQDGAKAKVTFAGIDPSDADDLVLADGLDYRLLVSWGDKINEQSRFGFNNDYIAFLPSPGRTDEGILWVNHEYPSSRFVAGYRGGPETKEQVDLERASVGGSILKVKMDAKRRWVVQPEDPVNRRIDGTTEMRIDWDEPIRGSSTAVGTLGNCSGGVTPWGTILTCEENYHGYYGETDYADPTWERRLESSFYYNWQDHYDNPPEHYGWVVEVDPKSGDCRKLIAMGRCAHECATLYECSDKRLVVYTGDDANDQCLYKFISDKPGDISRGTLYVANLEEGRWVSLRYEDQPILQENFRSQTEVLIRLREAAHLVGGSKLDRPEDIEIDPETGDVLIALTNNVPKGEYHGQILKITESSPEKTNLDFTSSTYLAGGEETGFACPDNMAFDPMGNLWITSDISGGAVGRGPYKTFKNNGLFLVPRSGERAGEVIQIASAPVDAELTGPCFTPDGSTLFLSIQHPGETSRSMEALTSHWPDGGSSVPRPSVVAIQGKALDMLMGRC